MTAADKRAPSVTLGALFASFFEIAVSSFGGALAWARRVFVDRRRWFTDREFAELMGICQVLPGGNVLNLAVFIGARSHGPLGAIVALAGLLSVPLVVIVLLGELYAQGAQLEWIRTAVRGAAPAAVGLLLATGLKLGAAYRHDRWALLVAGLAFLAVGVARLPLIPVFLLLGPLGIVLAWRRAR